MTTGPITVGSFVRMATVVRCPQGMRPSTEWLRPEAFGARIALPFCLGLAAGHILSVWRTERENRRRNREQEWNECLRAQIRYKHAAMEDEDLHSTLTDEGPEEEVPGTLVVRKYDLIDTKLHRECQRIAVNVVEYDRKLLKFEAGATVRQVLDGMRREDCACVLVYKRGRLCGILDVTDVVAYFTQNALNLDCEIRRCLRKMVYVYSNANLLEAAQYLKSGFRYIVVQGSQPSILSQGSVLRYLHHSGLEETTFDRTI
ncbi:MAG: CBS domain-containing protein, partial [Actinomycetota bacterium]|nr:CBS domain-containing protein [Actinomycetota bacterium]